MSTYGDRSFCIIFMTLNLESYKTFPLKDFRCRLFESLSLSSFEEELFGHSLIGLALINIGTL